MSRRFPLGLFVVFVSACGGSGSSPATPASPTPSQPIVTVTNVAISGPQVVLAGSSVTYSATATSSNGAAIRNARPTTWNTDNAHVATINSALDGVGELTGLGQGTATITATYQGTSGVFSVQVRAMSEQKGGANLAISFIPDPVPASQMPCPSGLRPPTWAFTEVIRETQGVGFKVEMATLVLYNEDGKVIYLATEPEEYYFAPNSVFMEESCIFGSSAGGFYSDSLEGVDDRGNRLAFASRLRLLTVVGVSPASSRLLPAPMAAGTLVRRALRRVR